MREGRDVVLKHMGTGLVGVEVGVHLGAFSRVILDTVRPKQLYLVDPWLYQPDKPKSVYGGTNIDQRTMDDRYWQVCAMFRGRHDVIVIRHESHAIATGSFFEDESLDWVYIDGDHSYDGVTKDITSWWPKIKTGGMIMGDDYNRPGMWWGVGLDRAWNEFVSKHNYSFEFIAGNQVGVRKKATW